jgi:putative membrane protein
LKFLQRFIVNTVAVFLAVYLVDSVAGGRFLLGAVWVAVLLALVTGLVNSFIRPLHRVRTKTARSLIVALLTLVANALIIQVFAWATPLLAVNLSWVVGVAAFLEVLTGALNWLIGFTVTSKGRPYTRFERGPTPKGSGRGERTQGQGSSRKTRGA